MKKNSSEQYKRRIKRRRIFLLCVFLLVVLLCICLFTPLFGISEITVTGNSYLSPESIVAESGIEKGENVFRIRAGKAEKKLRAMAYVEDVAIKRKFPAKIVIDVDEAKQDIIINTPTEFIVTTISGRVLEKTEDVSALTAPIVYGIEVADAQPAKPLESANEEAYQTYLGYLQSFYATSYWADIDEFYVSEISNFRLIMKSGMKVTFGHIASAESLQRKIMMMEKILPQIKQTDKSYLDLTTDKGYFGEYTQEELEEMERIAKEGSFLDAGEENKEDSGEKTSQSDKDTDTEEKN